MQNETVMRKTYPTSTYLAIDIGGSHISGGLIDSHGNLIESSFCDRTIHHSLEKEECLSQWEELILSVSRDEQVKGIGVSLPGPFDYKKGIAWYDQNKFTQFYGFDYRAFLNAIFPSLKETDIRFINDADAFAYGEYWKGALRLSKRPLIITLGTGMGASFVLSGACVKEGKGIPKDGELYDKEFKDGLADFYFSTRGLQYRFKRNGGHSAAGAKEIADLAREGDKKALASFREFGEDLAIFLKPYLKSAYIDTLAIGGNIAKSMDLFLPTLETKLKEADLKIVPTDLDSKAPLYGAAYSFFDEKKD